MVPCLLEHDWRSGMKLSKTNLRFNKLKFVTKWRGDGRNLEWAGIFVNSHHFSSCWFLLLALCFMGPLPPQPFPSQAKVNIHGKVHQLSLTEGIQGELVLKVALPLRSRADLFVGLCMNSLACSNEDGGRNVYHHLPWTNSRLWNEWREHNNTFDQIELEWSLHTTNIPLRKQVGDQRKALFDAASTSQQEWTWQLEEVTRRRGQTGVDMEEK